MRHLRRYSYVGPAELHDELPATDAIIVVSRDGLDRWLAECARADLDEPFTFVVALDGRLRLAPRRSEGDFTCALCDSALRTEWNFALA